MKEPKPGWIYILTHPVWRNFGTTGMLKIGKTTRDPRRRLAEITSSSGLLAPGKVAWCVWVSDITAVEVAVHALLSQHRIKKGRELFAVDVKTAQAAINQANDVQITHYPIAAASSGRRSKASYRVPRRRWLPIRLQLALILGASFLLFVWASLR